MYTRASRVHPAVARKPCQTFIIQRPRIEGTRMEQLPPSYFSFLLFFFFRARTNESRKGRGKVSIDAKYMYIDRIGGRESRVEKNLLQTQIHFVLRIIQLQTLTKL